jgi:hypothetical protein
MSKDNGHKPVGILAIQDDSAQHSKVLHLISSPSCLLLILIGGVLLRAEDVNQAPCTALRDRVMKGDKTVDFRELRLGCGQSPGSVSEPDLSLLNAMYKALEEKKYAKAIDLAQKALERNYVDIDAHMTLFKAYTALDNAQQAAFYKDTFRGLFESILNSGDGKSIETAYTVISQREEKVVFALKNIRPVNQIYQVKAGHSFDVFDTVGESGDKQKMYFNVDISVAQTRVRLKY